MSDPFARLRAPAVWAALADGATRCARGAWWDAHESWETAWRAYRGGDRGVLQALIQIAAVNWHLERGRVAPARSVLGRALGHLDRTRPWQDWPFPIARLQGDALRMHGRLAATTSIAAPAGLIDLTDLAESIARATVDP